MSRHRSITALLIDVPAGRAAQVSRVLDDAGWKARTVGVQGPEALTAALQRRGWDTVLYGGDGPLAVPSRKALELVRLADPHLPFLAVSPRPGPLSVVLRGVPSVLDLATLPAILTRELEQARMRRRVGGAHRLLAAQQAIADHLAAGLEPAGLCDRVLATLGDALGWTFGVLWRPDGTVLRCTSLWTAPGARAGVTELATALHGRRYAAGQGLAGRVWAFRRPVWLTSLPGEAVRGGLVSAAAFPIAHGDACVGVIELYASDVREPNAEVSALYANVGGQVASYLARRRSFDGAAALVVALDADGRIELANGTACATFGLVEPDGCDWFAVAFPQAERASARAAFAALLAGAAAGLPGTRGIAWRWSVARDPDGRPVGAVGWGEPA